jgi:hypothetical protein
VARVASQAGLLLAGRGPWADDQVLLRRGRVHHEVRLFRSLRFKTSVVRSGSICFEQNISKDVRELRWTEAHAASHGFIKTVCSLQTVVSVYSIYMFYNTFSLQFQYYVRIGRVR